MQVSTSETKKLPRYHNPLPILGGAPETSFLQDGDTVRIWMEDKRCKPIFGIINQQVKHLA